LSDDLRDVVVEARLLRSAASVPGRIGVRIVRLGTELQDISTWNGHYRCIPFRYRRYRRAKSDFVGMEGSQGAVEPGGLEIVLRANRLDPETPVARLLSRYRGGGGARRPAQRRFDHGGNPRQIRPRYVKLVRSQLEVLEFERSGREVRLVQRPGNQCGVAEVLGGRGDCLRHPGRSKARQASDGAHFPFTFSREEWLGWAPRISIHTEGNSTHSGAQKVDDSIPGLGNLYGLISRSRPSSSSTSGNYRLLSSRT